MFDLRMNIFRYIQRLKQYSLSTSAKHMLSTVIGVLLTSNILSVVLIMLLHNYIATEFPLFPNLVQTRDRRPLRNRGTAVGLPQRLFRNIFAVHRYITATHTDCSA